MGCLCNPNFMPVHFKLDKHEIRNALACIFRLPQTVDNKPFTNLLIFVRKPEDFLSVFLFIFLPKIHSSSLPPSLFSPFICHLLPCMPPPLSPLYAFLPFSIFRFSLTAGLIPFFSASFPKKPEPKFYKSRNPSPKKNGNPETGTPVYKQASTAYTVEMLSEQIHPLFTQSSSWGYRSIPSLHRLERIGNADRRHQRVNIIMAAERPVEPSQQILVRIGTVASETGDIRESKIDR